MMIELSYYPTDFEAKFLNSTSSYYSDESNQLINQLSVPEYIQHANKRRSEESVERIKNYLDVHTKQALANVVTNQMIYSKAEIIIKKGLDTMLHDNLIESLKILYELLSLSPKISLLRQAFGEYIKTQGVLLIKNPLFDATMIVEILKFKKKLDNILTVCFENDVSFQNSLKESFEYFINSRANKPAELLAKFIDSKLKNPLKVKKKKKLTIVGELILTRLFRNNKEILTLQNLIFLY